VCFVGTGVGAIKGIDAKLRCRQQECQRGGRGGSYLLSLSAWKKLENVMEFREITVLLGICGKALYKDE